MEDEERQKKLEAGKAKLAEYRQRKAHADTQKKQKKKKRKPGEESGGDSPGGVKLEQDQHAGEKISGGGIHGVEDPPTTEFTFSRTLRSGETVKHDQTYTIEPESEVSTTAEDYSSEVNGCHEMTESQMESSKDFVWEEVESLQQVTKGGRLQDMADALAAKTQAVEELSQELEAIRAVFGKEGVQQLQDFEAALKQRDGIITQLTANLQQARQEKDDIMREFLELTEQSQKLHIQFQQLQAGETLRNTSHSSAAADLLQARQQIVQYQQQIEEMSSQVRGHQERNDEQLLQMSQLTHTVNERELAGRRSEESFAQKCNEKDLLIAEQKRVMLEYEQSLKELRTELAQAGRVAEASFTQTLNEKELLISEQNAIITDNERSLNLLREELSQVGRSSQESVAHHLEKKDQLIAEQERVISEHESSLSQLKDKFESSQISLNDLTQQMSSNEFEIERRRDEFESSSIKLESYKSELESCKVELESCKVELEKGQIELESCRGELLTSRQKEKLSSNEIMQLMGTVEDLQKRCHQGSLSESDNLQRVEKETAQKLEHLRSELDEMYGQQIVQMKQELNLRHAAVVDRMTEQHQAVLELLKTQLQSKSPTVSADVVDELNAKVEELEERLEESQAMHKNATHELSQVAQEKLSLQARVDELLHDLRSAKDKEKQSLVSQESQQSELQQIQDTIDDLRRQLTAAKEDAEEAEVKHESETTNYKIKLEMLEREKDAVLDRMAESQEAELERLRTQLLFSHEEELTLLREDLQRESFLNAENLLNEASIKHERALEELRVGYEERLRLSGGEKANFLSERDELLHQILALKEELNLALHSSKANELVLQLQELQVEVEELRKGGDKTVQMEQEIQTLLRNIEVLEAQKKEKDESWENKWKEQESEKETMTQSNNGFKVELDSQIRKVELLTAENNQMQQQVVELKEEIEKQRTTFSFAEKNFEVNYQELKEEYSCLVEVKRQLEEKILKDTLELEAKIASLQSHIRGLEESSKSMENTDTDSRPLIEKDTTELMEKLDIVLSEKQSLTVKLSEVLEQLTVTEGKLTQVERELMKVKQENEAAMTQNKSMERELESQQETLSLQMRGQDAQSKAKRQQDEQHVQSTAPACTIKDHHLQIESLHREIETLRSLLSSAEVERDTISHALEEQRLKQTTSSPATTAAQYSGEGPVEGRSSLQKPSGSSKRRRRQRTTKQEHKSGTAQSDSREEREREEEEEPVLEEGEKARSAAEPAMQAQMKSQVTSHSQQRARKEGSTDGYQGDGGRDYINKRVTGDHGGEQQSVEPVVPLGAEEAQMTTEHGECRLQLEAQRISLSQIHAAQLELLQEQADAHTHTLDLELQRLKEHGGQDVPKFSKYQNVVQAVSEECKQLILSLAKHFGEELLESVHQVDVKDWSASPVEGEIPTNFTAALQEARELYRDLQQVKEIIEQEHGRLSQLQALLRADGNKMTALQTAYDELRSTSKREISSPRLQVDSSSSCTRTGLEEQTEVSSSSHSADLERLKTEVQEKQMHLEERHRQEMERLRAHYQQQAAETEERYATELIMMEQRLQEATGSQTQLSLSGVGQSSSERTEEDTEELMRLVEAEGILEEGSDPELQRSISPGLTAQLQTLKKALYHKYVQEVAALKEQHRTELRGLMAEREGERRDAKVPGGETEEREALTKVERDLDGGAGRHIKGPRAEEQVTLKQNCDRVEREVAKVIVQMSVEFAQQTELARLSKHTSQTTSSMQTQEEEEGRQEREVEEQVPKVYSSPEEGEKERLEKELRESTAELQRLKEQLWKTEQALQEREKDKRGAGEEKDKEEPGIKEVHGRRDPAEVGGDSSSLDVITTERNQLRKAYERLRQVLIEVLKTTAAAEETIGLHVDTLRKASGEGPPQASSQPATWPRPAGPPTDACQVSETGADDVSAWSGETDEGLEVSQQITESLLLLAAEGQLENEDYLMGISTRLQVALERMLVAITQTTNQLEHARVTQTELMRESFRHNQEIGELLQRQEELQERLAEEARAREQLALELHKAEGVIDGYTGERAALEEQARLKEELQLSLEQELQVTSSRLHELEQERLQMQEERELLSRQQDAMREHAGPRELRLVDAAVVAAPEADLLEETEKLMKEKVDVQRQAEKENSDLLKHVKLLEAELEEQVNRVIELEQAQKTEAGDLQQQIQALEKQLDKNRRFLDEQAVDREHERDVFQQEIHKLEQQIKNPQKLQSASEQRNREVDGVNSKVDQLSSQLKEKADWCSELLLVSEQLRREVGERDEEIDKLESRVRELEQALLASTESLQKTEEKKRHETHSTLEAQLQTEREALERKEREIVNLEEQLEQFKEELENKSEEVQQLQMQLEIQRKELSSQQQYLDNRDSMLQVMEEKDREIALLNEQITKLHQMETASDNKEMGESDELIRDLESQVECMRSEQERLKRNNEEELDQLNAVIDKLQQELANIEQKQTPEEEEDTKAHAEGEEGGPSKEEFDEMKQRMDLSTKELDTLKAEHGKLLDTYRHLKESAAALAKTENLESSGGDLQEALRQKTAGLVVMQAQVQALEQSATSRVDKLSHRVQDLEDLVSQKDGELTRCRRLVEQAHSDADLLQQKVSDLEEKLRERVAAALVSQVQLEAIQEESQQYEEHKAKEQNQDSRRPEEFRTYDFGDLGIPRIDFGGLGKASRGPTGKVVHLTEKLRELEVGLSCMQKDQELQKQLLSSSEEEVLEYERRLAVLMDLLNQMKAKAGAHPRTPLSVQSSIAGHQIAVTGLLGELQEVKDEATVTKEQLNYYKQSCSRLQEELKEKETTMDTLKEQLQREASRDGEEAKVSEVHQQLLEVQEEAAVTKEELSSSRESYDKLQELLQERELTIAHLKGELYQATSEVEGAGATDLLQELQEVRNEAAATKEELNSFRERAEKLQDELQVRDLSIAKLKDELQEVRTALARTVGSAPPSPSPSPQLPSSTSSSSSAAQPKRKGAKQQVGKGGSAKDKLPLSRKSSATATGQSADKARSPPLASDSQRQQHHRVAVTDSATQTEALQMPVSASDAAKEQVEEVIGEFQEKIDQMQELHAAEILDMEARHISESETLRRDVQALEEECKALKAVIDKLRSSEAPASRMDRPTSLHFRDGYTSDSSSDYSQRTGYDLPNLQHEFRTTPEGARIETDDPLPDKIKTLLREVHQEGMQVLSLSELPEGEPPSQLHHAPGWIKERDALLATVDSLKGLITQMQTHRETQTPGGVDWRGELLAAVQQVFVRERSVLKSALYSQLDLLDTSDAIIHLNQLERRLAEQDAQHREAMGSLHTADRSSLISEVRQLRAQMEQLHQGLQPAVLAVDLEEQRKRGGAGGVAEADAEELKGELAQTKLELETTLKAQHKHLKELDMLRAEVSQKASEVHLLTDQLSEEHKKSRELQWATEKERCRTGRKEDSEREQLEDLHITLGEEQSHVAQLTSALEQERQASSRLSHEAEQERLGLHRRLQELQVQLETERAKAQEVRSALGRERELRTGVSSEGGPSAEAGLEEHSSGLEVQEEGTVLERLQRELDDKHTQVVHLLGEVEAQKLEAVRRVEELSLTAQRSRRDQEALQEARSQLQSLETRLEETQAQLEREVERMRSLEEEKEKLEERVAQLGQLRLGESAGGGPDHVDGYSQATRHSDSADRTKDWVLQQKSGDAPALHSASASLLEATRTAASGGPHVSPACTTDRILGKLHTVASKIHTMASQATGRLTEVNSEDLSWLRSNIDEVITMLQQSPELPSAPESTALQLGASSSTSSTLTERLLRQNAELTGFVSRLTEEKNDLRNQILRLEEELRRYRQAGLGSGDSSGSRRGTTKDPAGNLLSQEREAWSRERERLEKSLQMTQAQVTRLKGEIRTEALRDMTGPEADNAALKRMYGKYLRSESFRKALIYQKKYLLLLLGGFQECEEATLSLISRMGGRPSSSSLESLSQRRRGLTRFRSAVRVSIALSRMRFLVKRWQKATGTGSFTSTSIKKNGVGQTIGTETRESPYHLHPGSVDVYRDRGGGGGGCSSSSRGRSGRESPRSAVSSSQHRFHLAVDAGALSCSHLQNYDPDRALTDYISRLEALQRRLGSVTSGQISFHS